MEHRKLGKSSIEVAPLAFGGNVFGWTAGAATSFRLLDGFVAAGFNFIDTADVYCALGSGQLRGRIGNHHRQLAEGARQRDKVVIATKFGMEMGPSKKGLSRAYMMQAVEASLRRLQTDYIDLYQSHRDDPDTPAGGNRSRPTRTSSGRARYE